VSGEYDGLQVVDVSNPASPKIVGTTGTVYSAAGVEISGDVVCMGGGESGLVTFPTQCALTPVRLASFTSSPEPQGILLKWASSSETDFSGFHVHRSLQAVGNYERLTTELIKPGTSYSFLDRQVTPGITYFYRLEALDRTGEREFFGPISSRSMTRVQPMLGPAFPNPVHNGSSTIPFSLAVAGRVRIRVLDLAGKEVRVVLDELVQSGEHSAIWEGRNEKGQPLPPGIYIYQLQTPGFEASRKLVRLGR
jgi:FlgD Ig-like domain/LVIVD repeat